MNNISFSKIILFAFAIVLFASCDNNYNDVGSNIVGNDNYNIGAESYQVSAYNQKLGPVAINNLPINPLGIYTNPAFGTTTANVAVQVLLTVENPTISTHPLVQSVVLTIPYFSTLQSTNSDGSGVYKLDSIYGQTVNSKIKLSVFEELKYIRSGFDPSTQLSQIYYTDQNSEFAPTTGTLLNDSAIATQNNDFVFSNAEHTVTTVDGTTTTITRTARAMRLDLNTTFFQNKLFGPSATGQLANNNTFENYFRGLYFKVENSGPTPNMALLDFSKGLITVNYTDDSSVLPQVISIKLSGSTVSFVDESNINPSYSSTVNVPDPINGDSKLYLKGGDGSMSVINLFGPGELENLRASKRLINNATLTFYIDRSTLDIAGGVFYDPNRIYLYDLYNKTPLRDYSYDVTTRSAYKYNKYVHGGIIDKSATKYSINLTNHIRNLISNDTVTNVKLGLVVTENINDISNLKLEFPIPIGTKSINVVPRGSVINPLGTVLFGTNASLPVGQKATFEIIFTKPN